MNNLEKRNTIEAAIAPFSKALLSQSTPVFMKMAAELRAFVALKLAELQSDRAAASTPANVDHGGGGSGEALVTQESSGPTLVSVPGEAEQDHGLSDGPSGGSDNNCGDVHVDGGADDHGDAHADDGNCEDADDYDDNYDHDDDYLDEDSTPLPGVGETGWLEESMEHAREMDRVIAEAIADEEDFFQDSSRFQRREGAARRRTGGADTKLVNVGTHDQPLAQLFDVVGTDDFNVAMSEYSPLVFPESLIAERPSPTVNPVVSVHIQPADDSASARGLAVAEDSLTELDVEAAVESSAERATTPRLQLPPLPAQSHHSPTSTTSMSMSALSSIMHSVAAHQVKLDSKPAQQGSPQSTASMSSSTMSAIMHSVADHQLSLRSSAARAPGKRRASGKTDSINIMRALAVGESAEDASAADVTLTTLPPRKKSRLASIHPAAVHGTPPTLPRAVSAGRSKQQKTNGDAGPRAAFLDQGCDFSLQLSSCSRAITAKQDVFSLMPLCEAVPQRFTDAFVDRVPTFAEHEHFDPAAFLLNYRVPVDLLERMEKAMKRARALIKKGIARQSDMIYAVDSSDDETESTAATETTSAMRVGPTSGLVVHLDPRLRGFNEANITDLGMFYRIRSNIASFRSDETWLQSDGDAVPGVGSISDVPYLRAKIDVYNSGEGIQPEEGDVSLGARAAIVRALRMHSLSARNVVSTSR